ncbi:hypothetical protein OG943_47240 [Amycolatopsis sp. NBC_00345]|uniref:hypothetical protein n=1 Tax=Amycolatopsis sp. NBC_00345 TaxID=2975955 RepID=UPI002E26CF76
MRKLVARTVISGSLLGVALTIAACDGGAQAAQPFATSAAPTATSSAPAPSTTASAVPTQPQARAPKPTPSGRQAEGASADKQKAALPKRGELGKTVDCGKIDGPTGKIDVVAEAMPAGTVGCTEAIDVLSDYLAQAPTKSQGTAHVLDVDGWQCAYDGGAVGSGLIGCGGKGLSFHGQP